MRLPQLTFGKVLAGTAVVLVLTTGTAYAHGPITSADIVNGSIRSVDIGSGEVKGRRHRQRTIRSADIFNGRVSKSADVLDDSLTADDLATNSVGPRDPDRRRPATEIADNTIDSGEIVDNSLFAADLGSSSVGSTS